MFHVPYCSGDIHGILLSEKRHCRIMWVWFKAIFKNKRKQTLPIYKWTYLQDRNRVTDVENKLMVTKGEGGEG